MCMVSVCSLRACILHHGAAAVCYAVPSVHISGISDGVPRPAGEEPGSFNPVPVTAAPLISCQRYMSLPCGITALENVIF